LLFYTSHDRRLLRKYQTFFFFKWHF